MPFNQNQFNEDYPWLAKLSPEYAYLTILDSTGQPQVVSPDNPIIVALAAGTALIGSVGLQRQLPAPSATITRPATTPTYAAGAAIGDVSGTAIIAFPNIVRAAGEVMLTSITVELDVASSAIGAMTLHLFNASPTAIADTDVWSFPAGDRGKWIADVQLVAPTDKGSTLVSSNDQINKQITMTGTTLYAILTTDISFLAAASTAKVVTPHLTEM